MTPIRLMPSRLLRRNHGHFEKNILCVHTVVVQCTWSIIMLEVVPSASAPASAPAPSLGSSPSTAGREL